VRSKACLLLWILSSLAGCASHHPLGDDWQGLTLEDREVRAIETLRTTLAERGARIPDHPGTEENQVLFADRRLAVYRPCCQQSGASPPPGSLAVLLLEDILRLERRVLLDLPSQPEDLSIYLRRESPSAWAVQAYESLTSPLLSKIGLEGPILLLPQRPNRTYWRLKSALEYLLALPPPRQGVGPTVERILRQTVEHEPDRASFEAKILAALDSPP
jgi:hypothetical protein